jgi:hypothetical protein
MTATLDRPIVSPRRVYTLPPLSIGIGRTMDAAHLNRVANHPAVRPWLGGDGVLDLTALITNPDNIAVVSEHGGFIGVAQAYGRYEVHSLFTPDRPGAETMQAMRAGLDFMFTATDCLELVTKVPQDNRAAAALALRAGFEQRWTAPLKWTDGQMVTADFLGLTLERWALRSPQTPVLGEWFHHAVACPEHPDDPVHDRIVGATAWMLSAGNLRKAVEFYNGWARLSGYTPVIVLRDQPIVLDVDRVILECRATEMEVLSCPQEQ